MFVPAFVEWNAAGTLSFTARTPEVFSFRASFIGACCPIDTPPTIETPGRRAWRPPSASYNPLKRAGTAPLTRGASLLVESRLRT